MELISLVLIVILIIAFVNMNKDEKITQGMKPKKTRLSLSDETKIIKNRGKQSEGNFPIPQTTTELKRLSPDYQEDLSVISSAVLPSSAIISELRTTLPDKQSHYPEYYRKDNMSGNTLSSTELYAVGESDEPAVAWSDENVSQYPKYYKSNFTGGLTSPGSFFDQNNQYVDLTGPRSEANVGDVCYVSKDGDKVCLENDKLQNVPPSLIDNVNKCGFLNNIGLLEYSNKINESQEKVINGGTLYGGVKGAMKQNETPSTPLGPQFLSCSL